MFVRTAARSFALALGLVALLAGASAAPAAEEAAAPPAKKTVNVNQASADELARLPRVGPSLAGKILSHREKHGSFKRAEDLMEVSGIGEKMFAALKPYVSVSGPTTLTEKVSSKGTGTAKAAPKAKAPAAPVKAGR
jgi:competence protein ComEA